MEAFMFGTTFQLPQRAARAAMVAWVLVSGTLTGIALAAAATQACYWLFPAQPIITSL
jgi:hypothetical protein